MKRFIFFLLFFLCILSLDVLAQDSPIFVMKKKAAGGGTTATSHFYVGSYLGDGNDNRNISITWADGGSYTPECFNHQRQRGQSICNAVVEYDWRHNLLSSLGYGVSTKSDSIFRGKHFSSRNRCYG